MQNRPAEKEYWFQAAIFGGVTPCHWKGWVLQLCAWAAAMFFLVLGLYAYARLGWKIVGYSCWGAALISNLAIPLMARGRTRSRKEYDRIQRP